MFTPKHISHGRYQTTDIQAELKKKKKKTWQEDERNNGYMLCVSFGWGIFLIETGFQYSSMNVETLKYVQGEGNGEMPQTPPDSTCFQCDTPPAPP